MEETGRPRCRARKIVTPLAGLGRGKRNGPKDDRCARTIAFGWDDRFAGTMIRGGGD
jgi:hypothetical protein